MGLLQTLPPSPTDETFLVVISKVLTIGLGAFLIGGWFLWLYFRALQREGTPEDRKTLSGSPLFRLGLVVIVIVTLMAVLMTLAQP